MLYKMKGEKSNMEGRRFDNRNDRSGERSSSGGRGNSGGRSSGGRNSGGRGNFNKGPQKMHKAICTACKKECEVPFEPTEGRDVFCQECFKKNNPRN